MTSSKQIKSALGAMVFAGGMLALVLQAKEKMFMLPPETAKLKPGAGVELATAQCLLCHSADYIGTQPRLTRQQWMAEVSKMQQKYGAPILTNKVSEIVDYLTANYGVEAGPGQKKAN